MSEQYWKRQAFLLAVKNQQLCDALDEATKDLVAYQINARAAIKRDLRWDGVPEVIQPTIDNARKTLDDNQKVDTHQHEYNQTLNYKGYQGSVEIDLGDNILYGKLLWINDLVTYESKTIDGIREEFESAIDEYIELCKKKGIV